MPGVVKKTKSKAAKKVSPVKKETKFVSESLAKAKQGHKKHPKQKRRGVVYIKHLPHGFFEEQLRGYFSQFGAITRLRLARSTRTLGSKGYAFIEFRYPEVAEIAADAMNNYLMFKNIIKTVYIQPSEIKYDYFRSGVSKIRKDGQKMLTSKTIQARETIIENTNRLLTDADEKNRIKKVGAKVQKAKQKLAALGIDYDIDSVAQNMGEKVMQAAEKKSPKTIESLELESEDEADETFDPANVDIESDDEFEDFEYASDNSDDDEDVTVDSEKLDNAIKVAKAATSKAKIAPVPVVAKEGKRKLPTQPEVPAKVAKKGKENKTVAEPEPKIAKKSGRNAANKAAPATEEPTVAPKTVKKPAKRAAKGKAPVEIEAVTDINEAPTKKAGKKTTAAATKPTKAQQKKAVAKESSTSPAVPKPKGKKAAAVKLPAAPVTDTPPKATKGKKAQKAKTPESPKETKKPKRNAKKAPQQPESPVPVKTKKLAKTSTAIEKKKSTKAADKKLKTAANLTSAVDSELVTVVKGKEPKGKKKAAAKK